MRWLDGITDSMDVSLSELRGVGDGQGGLACCDSWGRKELDTTEVTHIHQVGDAIQPSHPLSSPFPPAPNLSQNQSLFH